MLTRVRGENEALVLSSVRILPRKTHLRILNNYDIGHHSYFNLNHISGRDRARPPCSNGKIIGLIPSIYRGFPLDAENSTVRLSIILLPPFIT